VAETAPPKLHRRYRFRVAGTGFSAIAGRDVTGLYYDEIGAPERAMPAIRALDLVVERKAPVYLSGRLTIIPSQDHIWIKRLGLPLAQDGEKVDMILAIWLAECRSAADPARETGTPMVLERRQSGTFAVPRTMCWAAGADRSPPQSGLSRLANAAARGA